MKLTLFKFVLVLFLSGTIRAQLISPILKNINEGLPSSEVHNLYQDSIGYIWFATDRGICKYDGQHFYKINTSQQLYSNVIFNFFPESNTKVWISTEKNRLYWFNPLEDIPTFYPSRFNDELEETMVKLNIKRYIRKIYFEKNGEFKATFLKSSGYVTADKNGKTTLVNVSENDHINPRKNLYVKITKDFISSEFVDGNQESERKIHIINEVFNDTFLFDLKIPTLSFSYGISDFIRTQNETFLLLSDNLIRVDKKGITHKKTSTLALCLLIEADRIFIGTYSGVYEFDLNLKLESHFLRNESVTSILKDKEGGVWFSTLQNGVYYSKNAKLKKLMTPFNIMPSQLFLNQGKLEILDKIKNSFWSISLENDDIDSIQGVYIQPQFILTDNEKICLYKIDEKRYYHSNRVNNDLFTYLLGGNSNKKYLLLNKRLFSIKDSILQQIKDISIKSNPKDSYQIDDSTLLIATDNGLFLYNIESEAFDNKRIAGSENMNFIEIYNFQESILLFSNHGLFLYHDEIIKPIYKMGKVPFSKINGIYSHNDSLNWVYGQGGVFRIIKTSKQSDAFEFEKLDEIPAHEVISMTGNNNKLIIGTRTGIYISDLVPKKNEDLLFSETFNIDSVYLNGDLVRLEDKPPIKYNDDLILFFKLITFKEDNRDILEYKLNENVWLETNKNHINLNDLPSGMNTIKIRSKLFHNQLLYDETIYVAKPIYKRTWFILSIIILTLLIIFISFKLALNFKERRNKLKLEKLMIELKLLTSQMNPHFTFNSINSIQYYILKNNKDEAILYLSEFALLIRKSLDFSMNELVTIQEEIDFLNLYIKLENKRFDSKYIIDFQISPEIIAAKKIPTLLLQPLIENIIVHAEYESKEPCQIIVNIKNEHNYFLINVIDFGKSKSVKELKKHKSYGLSITRSRIKIYNGKDYKMSDLSLYPSDPELQLGTTVTIKLKEWTP